MGQYYLKFLVLCYSKDEANERLCRNYLDWCYQSRFGPIRASLPQSMHPLSEAWVKTFQNSAGYAGVDDLSSGGSIGGVTVACAMDSMIRGRSHSSSAYLAPVAKRPNLTLLTEAMVEKVSFNKSKGGDAVATGVQYMHNGESSTISLRSRGEVIICAGAFQSP